MRAKFKTGILLIIIVLFVNVIVSCKNKKQSEPEPAPQKPAVQNSDIMQRQLGAQDLLALGLAELNSANKNSIPEYSYNKALGFFNQVVTNYPTSFEAVEAQHNIAKFTEQKIKLLNLREINLRQRQGETLDTIRPFLVPYNQAIIEYIEIYNKKSNWSSFAPERRERAKFICTNALMQAAKLASDETNSKADYGKAVDIYKIVYKEFGDFSNFGDLALFSIVSIYFSQKEWQKVIEYAKIMEYLYPQSIYTVDVQNRARRAQFNLK